MATLCPGKDRTAPYAVSREDLIETARYAKAPVRGRANQGLSVGQGRKIVSTYIRKRRGSPPGIRGGRSGPGETTPNAAALILGENRIVPVGVGQSGSRHIGETFDALGTS